MIRRRLLVNYRMDPAAAQRVLPSRFQPKLYGGYAIAGICLIRLEKMRPGPAPEFVGLSSENAAHRIAVTWDDGGGRKEGVYIPRRDTDSTISSAVGGRLFAGRYSRAEFEVEEAGGRIKLEMRSVDGQATVKIAGHEGDRLPRSSIFASLEEASAFFECGSIGYSRGTDGLDGIELQVGHWRVRPFEVETRYSSYYEGRLIFPAGSVEFDHALIMRDVEHEWRVLDAIPLG